MKIIKKILSFLLILSLLSALAALGYYFVVTKGTVLHPEKLTLEENFVTVYDHEGESVLGAAGLIKQTTPIEKIPSHTLSAFVDVEDKRFFSHRGYDLKRIVGASLNNLKAKGFKEGASTISQQLIKNTHLSQEKTVKRKLREWKLTRALERRYSKQEILEMYLNTIYFGHSCFGITSAAEFYFGKAPTELTLGESAILAGLVKAPNSYSPLKNPEKCKARRQIVLSLMQKNGSISEEEKRRAEREPLPESPATFENGGYFPLVFDELTALAEKYDFPIGGRIEIFTYLQPSLQKSIEEIAKTYTESDKSILVLDGKSGGFTAGISTVGNIRRLPGSLIKPLLAYAPAIEEKLLSPATPILDEKINYHGYSPENYDGSYHGYVSARESMEKSLNIPAVKILESLTVKKASEYMRKMRLPVEKEDESLALALGGMKEGYALKDMLAAYACLQQGGEYQPAAFISAIRVNGNAVYTRKAVKTRVFSRESAYLTTNMLQSVAQKGTAKKLRSLPFSIAAKTGTAGTKKGNTDAYALSYTSLDCAAVWLGNRDNSPISHTGGGTPCELLFKVNEAIRREKDRVPDFVVPDKVVEVDLDKNAYYATHTLLRADDLAPAEFRVRELFKIDAIPLDKSTSFTFPTISPPEISFEKQAVTLLFAGLPTYYDYQIQRYDYATHTTLYEGEYLPSFSDCAIEQGKTYLYTVTPYYKGNRGAPVTLPAITTKEDGLSYSQEDILKKEWWDY